MALVAGLGSRSKVKRKVVLLHAMTAYRGCKVPLILNLAARWKEVVKLTARPFYPRVRTPAPQESRRSPES